jgi:serine/threonine protein kinase
MSFNVGENIGPYRIVEQLGQGGMASVFKAYHASLDRYVALKALHPAFNEDKNFASRFQREARVVAKLEHPNIVPVYDYAEHDGRPYLVMKFIEGDTLKARMTEKPLTSDEIKNVVDAVGSALTYAHKQGILHRDIKPSNVLIANDGQIYLADFGLARIAQSGESTMSSDSIMGTPQYISPEQAMGKKDLDARTDLYSFGVMVYEMVVGQVPFSADTPFAVIHDHIYTPMPLPRSVNPKIPDAVERMLLKALAKERDDRYEDAAGMVQAFKDAWDKAGISIQIPTPKTAKPPVATEAKTMRQSEPDQAAPKAEGLEAGSTSRKGRSPLVWVGAMLTIILCLGSLAYASNHRLFARYLANRQNRTVVQTEVATSPTVTTATTLDPASFGLSASATAKDSKPFNALDGDFDTVWNSAEPPVQWFQIDLGTAKTINGIQLVVAQFPAGHTVHQIWVGSKATNLRNVFQFDGKTKDRDTLKFKPVVPLQDIRIIRIVTTKSQSAVAWREIIINIP